jgi:hypothetical protein
METGFSHLPAGNLNFGCFNRDEAGLDVSGFKTQPSKNPIVFPIPLF